MLEKNSDSEVHVEKVEQRPMGSIAFGLERLGLIAVEAPILSCIVLVGLFVAALFGIDRIKIDDSLSQLFRSNSKEYRQYEAETKRFPAVEFDVLLVVEGKTLFSATISKSCETSSPTCSWWTALAASSRCSRRASRRRRQAACDLLIPPNCRRGPTTNNWSNEPQSQTRFSQQAALQGRYSHPDRPCAGPRCCPKARSLSHVVSQIRRTARDDLVRHDPDGEPDRGPGHAARDTERAGARSGHLQRLRLRSRLPDRDGSSSDACRL